MVIPFNDACFTGKKGDIKIAETTFGIHIIEILAQSKMYENIILEYIDRKILARPTDNSEGLLAKRVSLQARTIHYEKFTKAVAEQGLNKRVANDIAPQQKTLPGLIIRDH